MQATRSLIHSAKQSKLAVVPSRANRSLVHKNQVVAQAAQPCNLPFVTGCALTGLTICVPSV